MFHVGGLLPRLPIETSFVVSFNSSGISLRHIFIVPSLRYFGWSSPSSEFSRFRHFVPAIFQLSSYHHFQIYTRFFHWYERSLFLVFFCSYIWGRSVIYIDFWSQLNFFRLEKPLCLLPPKYLHSVPPEGDSFFNVTPFFDPINSSIFPYFVFSSIFIHHTCDRVCLGSIQKNFLFWAMFFTVHSIRHLQARPVCKYPSTLERILIFLFVLSPSPWVRNNQACWWTYWIIRKFCYLFRGKGYSAVTHLHFRSTKQRSVCTTINFARMCFGFAWYLTVPNDSEGKDRSWNIWTVENQKCFECSAQIAKLDHDSNPSTHQIICAPGESTD